jgi:class 3 adenylate cyclase
MLGVEQTFVFVDLSGFTALTEAHGDETGADLVERFVAIVREALGADGQLVGVNGDAVFCVAREPEAALRVVTRIFEVTGRQQDFPALRAGLHHGEATMRGEQFYGTAVNVAARVAAYATGGQALGTAAVATAARTAGRAVHTLGPVSLKNLRDPIELFWLGVTQDTSDVIDPVCRMRVVPDQAAAHLRLGEREYWFCSPQCLRAFVKSHGTGEEE